MDRVSQEFINRINEIEDSKLLKEELKCLERSINSSYIEHSKEFFQKMQLIKNRIAILMTKI